MTTEEIVEGVRRDAGLFRMEDRGLLEVGGEDRVRWLDGMISGDVGALVREGEGAGCYATLLTHRGAIVADLHVGLLGDRFLLESAREAIPNIRATLERFIIADDVSLVDRSDEVAILGLEGPRAPALLAAATAASAEIPADHWAERRIADRHVRVAAFGWTGERAFQLIVATTDREAVERALIDASAELVLGSAEALEILRVEAGIPLLGAELDEEVLPPEARLERAIAVGKGCYVGQEIVARLRARGQVNHLLVGLRLDSGLVPNVGTALFATGRRTGEITSVVRSPREGPIALGYVRRDHADEGTAIDFDGGAARVVGLPFVPIPSPGAGGP